MKNFDEPRDPAMPVPTTRSILEDARAAIVGDRERFAKELQSALDPISMSDEIREVLAREARDHQELLKSAMNGLATIELPKVDLSGLVGEIPKLDFGAMLPRVEPLEIELPTPTRSIEDIRLEALTDAVIRLIDVAEAQRDATLVSHSAAEARHAQSEALADARAERADNRAAWGVTFAGVAALLVVIEFFFR